MNIINELNQLLNSTLKEMTEDKQKWESFLQYISNMYRYDFFTLVTAFATQPDYKCLATFDYWNQSGRSIKKGEHTTRALDAIGKGYINLFDISQTRNNKPLYLWNTDEIKKVELEKRMQDYYEQIQD